VKEYNNRNEAFMQSILDMEVLPYKTEYSDYLSYIYKVIDAVPVPLTAAQIKDLQSADEESKCTTDPEPRIKVLVHNIFYQNTYATFEIIPKNVWTKPAIPNYSDYYNYKVGYYFIQYFFDK
jgi:hypothetical protein